MGRCAGGGPGNREFHFSFDDGATGGAAGCEDIFADLRFETAIAVPLHDAVEFAGVLFLGADAAGPELAGGDLEVLAQFAAHAGLAWRTSRLTPT